MTEPVVLARRLTKYYRRVPGLDGLDLAVPPGEVYGLLGPTGAGKTTTVRLVLGLTRPTGGLLRVFGLDPGRDGDRIRRRTGCLPDRVLRGGRHSPRKLLERLAARRGGVPPGRIAALADRFDLDLDRPLRVLPADSRRKVALVQAFMHRPDLLVLDEPTTGLDPARRHEVLALVRQARDNGQTVLLTSHLPAEVQQVADRVGILGTGRMVAVEQVDALRDRAVRRIEVRFDRPVAPSDFVGLAGVSEVAIDGPVLHCRLDGRPDALIKVLARHPVADLRAEEPDLEELLFTYRQREDAARIGS